jgi:hypothetical protein
VRKKLPKHEYEIEVRNVSSPDKYIPGAPAVIAYDYDVFRDVHTHIGQKRAIYLWDGYLWAVRVIYWDRFKLWIRRK